MPGLHFTHGFNIVKDHEPMMMPHAKRGLLLLSSVVLTDCFSTPLCIINGEYFHSKPSAAFTPPFATIPVPRPSICLRSKTWGSITITDRHVQGREETLRQVWPRDLPRLMLPRCLCVHMLGDYARPLKHPVDEIFRAPWAVYWRHKHCALSRPLGMFMWW